MSNPTDRSRNESFFKGAFGLTRKKPLGYSICLKSVRNSRKLNSSELLLSVEQRRSFFVLVLMRHLNIKFGDVEKEKA